MVVVFVVVVVAVAVGVVGFVDVSARCIYVGIEGKKASARFLVGGRVILRVIPSVQESGLFGACSLILRVFLDRRR